MTAGSVVLFVLVLGYVLHRRVRGTPITPRRLLVLPAVLLVVGYQDLTRTPLDGVDIAVATTGCALSLGLGAARGVVDRIESRDGAPWVRWGVASVAIFVVNVVAKLALDGIGVAAGGTAAAAASSLVLAAGLMLLGEAGVVWLRVQGGPGLFERG